MATSTAATPKQARIPGKPRPLLRLLRYILPYSGAFLASVGLMALVGLLDAEGTYEEPLTGGPLSGAALGEFFSRQWRTWPDLAFTQKAAATASETYSYSARRIIVKKAKSFERDRRSPAGTLQTIDLNSVTISQGGPS